MLAGCVAAVLLFVFAPIAWLVISSISTRTELLAMPPHWIPRQPSLANYRDILWSAEGASQVARIFKLTLCNSLIVAISVTTISLAVGALAAYAMTRMYFPFRRLFFVGILATRMVPEISLVIPLYLLASRVGLINTPYILIATYLSFSLPFAIWLMGAFFETLPRDLEDAGRMDGCSSAGILFRIIMPVSAPGLVSTALFTFLMAWDEFFFALILTSNVAAKTAPVAIAEFAGRYVVDITGMMTGGVLAAIPPVVLALVFQRYIVRGLTAGTVK